MAYADQEMSGNKIIAIIIVALIHVFVGYALVTGLAYEAGKKIIERVTTVDIKEPEPPKDEPPPPPPKQETAPPPPVAPAPPISIAPAPPPINTTPTIPPPAPPVLKVPPPAPPAPPPPKFQPKNPTPRGNPGNWATPNDYPSRALREEREGVTGFTVTVGTNGRVESCQITRSSGSPDLDEATCKFVTRRARFRPATDGNGAETTGTYSNAVRWVIPK